PGDRRGAGPGRRAGPRGSQTLRGRHQRARSDRGWWHRPGDQHAVRPGPPDRRVLHPNGRRRGRGPLHHDRARHPRRGAGHRGPPGERRGRGADPGVPCRDTAGPPAAAATAARRRRFPGNGRGAGGPMIRTRCEVLSNRRTGAYHSLTLVAPDIADRAKPGQFVQIAVPEGRETLLRRPFSIHQASRRGGWAGTLEIVLDARGRGTAWLAEARTHDVLDVIGPLGRGFSYAADLGSCLLVGGGYGGAPLFFLAEELRGRNKLV